MRLRLCGVIGWMVAGVVHAQSVERPVPFDSAGRVQSITPRFVSRFRVGEPWRVTGDFVEARLYARSEGGFVLVVQRPDGALERTVLTDGERSSLASAVSQSLAAVGGVATTTEGANILSQPAGGAFTRNMTLAGATIWGPSMAILVGDAPGSVAAYLATVGASFFAGSGIARSTSISRAQNHLATDGMLRGGILGDALAYVASSENPSARGAAAARMGGSILATGLGLSTGRDLSDGEAHGATWGSTYAGALAAGAIGVAGGWKESGNRGPTAGVMAAILAGYPFGLQWVRRSRYSITAGDVGAIQTASLIGVVGAATALADGSDERLVAGALTGGVVAGSIVGARALAKPFDLTESQSTQLNLGALAGGLIGLALPTLAQADDLRAYTAATAIGASIGMGVTVNLLRLREGPTVGGPNAHARVRLTPWNAVHLVGGAQRSGDPSPRRASLLSVQFR